MTRLIKNLGLVSTFILIFAGGAAHAQLRISEFMASNSRILPDEDGTFPDWIEIQNTSSTNADIGGWFLTDSASNKQEWQFPSTNITAGGYLVVFASGKDRRVAGAPLHTNFKLDATGEYLALVWPDGSIASDFSPKYPTQFPDVSYGISMQVTFSTLIRTNALVRLRIPVSPAEDGAWTQPGFADANWQLTTNGIGYETGLNDPLEDSYAGRVLQYGPELYWRLDETNGTVANNLGAMAATANGSFRGRIVLGAVGPRPPQFRALEADNRAAQFNGADSYVGGPKGLLDNASAFTMAGWIRPTGPQAGRTGLFGQNDTVEFGFIDAATIQLWTPANSVNVSYPFPSGEWHHVAAVGDSEQLALYFDGVLASSSSASVTSYGTSGYDFNAGGGGIFDPSGNPFLGQMDEIGVWSRALAPDEIAQLVSGSSDGQVNYSTNIATDVRSQMYGVSASAYVRIAFTMTDPSNVEQLTLRMRYDDGFVAYLNGQEIARKNAPATLAWNSAATARHPDYQAVQFEDFDVSSGRGFLLTGTNTLAIQGLNVSATNTDFLLQTELIAAIKGAAAAGYRFFVTPTPGGANGVGASDLGPILSQVRHTPAIPQDNEDMVITAHVAQAFNAVSNVSLVYRIMFNPEVTIPMNDSGTNGDATAGDGIWTGLIPASASMPGNLIRYYVSGTDTLNNTSRWPLFPNPTDSEQYWGTVVADPGVQTLLPVAHIFSENTAALDSGSTVRASLFYLGDLYDNIRFAVHGQSSSGWPKKGYNIDFNKDHLFLYNPAGVREKSITLISPYGDKTRMHTTLTYGEVAETGGVGHFSFQVRVQRNGAFYGIESMVESADENFLTRVGRDPNGALYKMYNDLSSAAGNEKKTRTWEDFSDLQTLIDNLDESRPLTTRVVYGYDNLDLSQTISYFANMALVSSQDHGHKNYYLYRDTAGTGEWTIFPWDVDLTWGRNWTDSLGYFSDILYQTNALSFYNPAQQGKPSNRLYDLVFNNPDFRRMYLRRLRTLMDTVLMPPGTPPNALKIEPRIRQLKDLMAPGGITNTDADLDRIKWGPAWGNPTYADLRVEAERTIGTHLAGRRDFLFNSPLAVLNGDRIPSGQPSNTVIRISGLDYSPVSGNQDEEYVQLTNTNSFATDVSGWQLAGAIQFTFKPGTVIPAGGSIYASPNVMAFRARTLSPHGGQGLYVQGNYNGRLSARGETITLSDDSGRLVWTKTYSGRPSLAQQFLRITEIMYNPPPTPGDLTDPQLFEYIELKNISASTPLDLTGVRFTSGISFDFTGSAATNLAPLQSVVIVRNLPAFRSRYGTGPSNIAGEYTGALDNNGEVLRLQDRVGENILEFTYDNKWYPVTDGLGFSLVIVSDQAPWDAWGLKGSWRPSTVSGGSPGLPDPVAPVIPPILISEALAHPELSGLDTIELFNPNSISVDLEGWFLSDDLFAPKKYRIPSGTTMAPQSYATFTGAQFGLGANGFGLSSTGDDVYIFSADGAGNLTGYEHGFHFGASPLAVSFGRYVNSAGEENFVLQNFTTLGTNNAAPRVGPAVISEIMYEPPPSNATNNSIYEYIELQNIASTNVTLYDPAHPTNTWRIRTAVDFDFPTNTSLAPGAQLLLVGFDPANAAELEQFQSAYNVPANVQILGPWNGQLNNAGETIELLAPDVPVVTPTNAVTPYYLVETVHYRVQDPWPTNASGSGNSLQRIEPLMFGNDPINWQSAVPSAGMANQPGPALDTDRDGVPDSWELAYGTNPYVNDSSADPDRDGASNLEEYWAGTNPTNSASVLRIERAWAESSSNIVLQFNAPANRAYTIEWSDPLTVPNWSRLQALSVAGADRSVQVTNQVGSAMVRFYRLSVPVR